MRGLALILLPPIGVLVLAFYLLPGKILFQGATVSRQTLLRLRDRHPQLEDLEITAADGVRLRGWLVKSARRGKAPLVIYFGGNGEEVSWMADRAEELAGWSLLLMNYRGYGLSEGRPSEGGLLRDAVHLYDQVRRRSDIDAERIVAMGRSLGSGIAVHLARERRLQGVVLVSPYDSITAVARQRFPFLPVRLLLPRSFEAAAWAAEARAPMLALIAAEDTVIPPERSRRLLAAWAGAHEAHVLAGAGHNSIDRHPEYWRRIGEFLRNRVP